MKKYRPIEALALAGDLLLLLHFTFGFPIYLMYRSLSGPSPTIIECLGSLVGVVTNWVLLVVFIKKRWNKVFLPLLFYPVLGISEMASEGNFLQVFLILILILGFSMLFAPHNYRRFLSSRFDKKFSSSLIRAMGGIIAIATTLLIILR